jgi:polyisoprenoid-binding protein YceI
MISKFKTTVTVFAFVLTSMFTLTSSAQNTTKWKLDKSHASVNFTANHFFSEVTGKFTKFDGTFNFDQSNLNGSKITFTIAVSSVNTDNNQRDNHIQSADFFDAKKYPTINFVSSRIEKVSDKDFIIYGNLTIRNTTKEVAIPFSITGEMEHPMMKGTTILGLALNTKINRTEYGIGTGNWASTMVVGDDVEVKLRVELNK